VAQAVGSLTDPHELYGRLTERIAGLAGARMCGFLLYDEQSGALVSQAPFFGIPESYVSLYRIPLPPGSRLNRAWREAEYWLSNDVANDPVIAEAGLAELAAAVGVQQTLLVPLNIGGQRLGVIQVSNKAGDTAFHDGDARQLAALANQAAALIDNARLVRETRVRAERAEGLRRLAAVAGSAQPLDDVLRQAVEETVRLLAADLAVILLLDEARGDLVPHAASAAGAPADFLARSPLGMGDPLYRMAVVQTRRPFLTNSAQLNQRLHPNYRAVLQALGLNGCLNVPLVVQERGIGEMIVAARRDHAFASTDLELLLIIAAQAASAVERARLAEATDDNLNRRVRQLTALARVSQQLNRTLDLERILGAVYAEASGEATQADYVSIVLLETGNAAQPDAGPRARQRVGRLAAGPADFGADGHPPAREMLVPAETAFLRQARDPQAIWHESALAEADRLALEARSALIVPIAYQETIVGLIHLQARAARAFDQSVVDFARALADQTAVAVGNAQRFEEQVARNELLRRRADQLAQLFQISRSVRADQPVAANLQAIAFGVQESAGFDIVILSLLNPVTNLLEMVASAGLPIASFERLKTIARPWAEVEPLLRDQHRISQSYFIPRRRRAATGPLASAVRAERPRAPATGPLGLDGWRPDDLLLVPFRGSAGEILGLMHLDEPRDGRVPDRAAVETLEIFANQAALAIESSRLYQTAAERAAELSQRLTDLSASYAELDHVSRSLVQKDQELTRLVDELDLRNRRMLSLQHVTEALGSSRDPQALLRLIAEAVTGEMQMEACLIALREPGSAEAEPRIAAAAGFAVPLGVDLGPLLPPSADENPIVYTFERNAPLLVRDVERSPWAGATLIIGLALRAFVCVPILLRGRISGTLFVGSQKALISFTEQDLDLYNILASQLGVSLENAALYAETQRGLLEQSLLYETSQELSRAAEAASVIAAVAERMVAQLDATALCYYAYDAGARAIRADFEYWTAAARPEERRPVQGQTWPVDDFPYLASALAAGEAEPGGPAVPRVLRRDDPGLSPVEQAMLDDFGGRTVLAVPMIVQERVLGFFEVWDSREARHYDQADLQLVQSLSNQAAVAYESVRLQAAVRERAAQLEALARVSRDISSTLRAEELVSKVLERLAEVIASDAASLWLAHESVLEVAAARGLDEETGRLGTRIELLGHPFVLGPEGAGQVSLAPAALAPGASGRCQSWLGAPLVSKGELLGLLVMAKVEPGFYGTLHGELVQAFAAQVATALDNARLYAQARQFNEQLERTVNERTRALQFERDRVGTLLRITSELSASLDLDRVLQRALALVNDVIGATQGSIFLVDPQSDHLLHRAALGRPQALPPGGQPTPFTVNTGLAGWVIKNRQPVVIGDLQADARWAPGPAGRDPRSALAAPLVTMDDNLGAIMFFSPEVEAFNADQLSLVTAAAAQVASAINNAELYRLIRDQAERLGAMLRSQQVEASKNRAILESIADGVMVADADGRIVLLNPAAERLLNLSAEILGEPAGAFVGLYGAAGAAWSRAIAQWQRDPGAYQPGEYLAERFEVEDKRVISVHLAPVTAGDDYLGSVSLFRDITREVEVDRLKTEFVTTVSHELRTPLTPIKGYVDALLLGMAGAVAPQQQQILGVIKANIDRLAVLVNDLLDISRIESGKVELSLEPVSVHELADEVVAALRARSDKEGKAMQVAFEAPARLPPMLADRGRILQVLYNLANNAFNYTPAGGSIRLEAREQSGVMLVSVRDTGIGIAPENLPRIFERFYRGDDPLVLATAGTGLGLSIVQYLIEMHNGRLWAESDGLGKGSNFTFLMPLAT
jgi:PAS domain S-box-containing protein